MRQQLNKMKEACTDGDLGRRAAVLTNLRQLVFHIHRCAFSQDEGAVRQTEVSGAAPVDTGLERTMEMLQSGIQFMAKGLCL